MFVNKESYEKIKRNIEATWPAWKKKLCNETLLISKNSKKLDERENLYDFN